MSQDTLLLALRWLFALTGVVLLVAFVVRPMVRMLRQRPDIDLLTPQFDAALEGEELEIPTEAEGGFNRNEAINAARADPQNTALLVQRWLKERR